MVNSLRHYVFSGQEGLGSSRAVHSPRFGRDAEGNAQRLYAMAPLVKKFKGRAYSDFATVFKAGATGRNWMAQVWDEIGANNNSDERGENLTELFCSEMAAEWFQSIGLLPEHDQCERMGKKVDAKSVQKGEIKIGDAIRTISCNSDVYQPTDFLPSCYK
jgi:hypothetical protein